MIEDQHLHDAIERIACTPDGRTLYRFLQKRMMAVATSEKSSALRADHGERRFASKLIGLMAKGIEDSAGRGNSIDDSTGARAEPLIVFARAEPRSVASTRGTGRRIGPDDRGFGYDRPGDA